MEEQEHRRYKWLRLLYKIQENKSPAVSKIKIATKAIEERKVYFDGISKYWFECEECTEKEQNSHFVRGHRHKKFNTDEIEKIKTMSAKGISNRQIAKEMGCSETTIRNYRKNLIF